MTGPRLDVPQDPGVHDAAERRAVRGALGVVADGARRGLLVEGVAEPREQLRQLVHGEEVEEHEHVRLLGHLVAVGRVALLLEDPVEALDVAVARRVAVPIELLEPVVVLELADDAVVEDDPHPAHDPLPRASSVRVRWRVATSSSRRGAGSSRRMSRARDSTQTAITLVYALLSSPGSSAHG